MQQRFTTKFKPFALLFVFFLVFGFISACTQPGGGLSLPSPTTDTLGGDATGDDIGLSTDGETILEDDMNSPAASIPLPDAGEEVPIPTPDASFIIAANNGVIQGNANPDLNPDIKLHVDISDPINIAKRKFSPGYLFDQIHNNIIQTTDHFLNVLTPSAQAATLSDCFDEGTDIEINPDGTIKAQIIKNFNFTDTMELIYTYFDPIDCRKGLSVIDKPFRALVYMKQVPVNSLSLTVSRKSSPAGLGVYQVDEQGLMVRMGYNANQVLSMQDGNFDDGYNAAEVFFGVKLEGFHYHAYTNSYIVNSGDKVRSMQRPAFPGAPLQNLNFTYWNGLVDCFDVNEVCSNKYIGSLCPTKRVKIKKNRTYISTQCDENQPLGVIHELFNNATHEIEFNIVADTGIDYKGTLAYDVVVTDALDVTEYLIATIDESGNSTLFAKYNAPGATLYSKSINTLTLLKELYILRPQSATGDVNGTAVAMYDKGIVFIDYVLYCEAPADCAGIPLGLRFSRNVAIDNPVFVIHSADLEFLYVLSNGGDATTTADDYITVLHNPSRTYDTVKHQNLYRPGEPGIIYLADLFRNKNLPNISPQAFRIIYNENGRPHIFVGVGALQSGFTFPLDTLKP